MRDLQSFYFVFKITISKMRNALGCSFIKLEKRKKSVETGKVFGALRTDLSKAFDRIPHVLIIAKLSAYDFTLPALNLIRKKKRYAL